MTIKIGITGGIGSGKSVVSQLLELMGIPIYLSDVESKRLTNNDIVIRRELSALLGDEVFVNGELNKPLLAAYLFGHPDNAARANAIIHPQVKKDFRTWVERHDCYPVLGIESAILIEAGFANEVDLIVMVYAPTELRVQRAINRDHATRELIELRMQQQMNDEEKRSKSDFVVINDDENPIIPQVLKLITFLSENNYYLCRAK